MSGCDSVVDWIRNFAALVEAVETSGRDAILFSFGAVLCTSFEHVSAECFDFIGFLLGIFPWKNLCSSLFLKLPATQLNRIPTGGELLKYPKYCWCLQFSAPIFEAAYCLTDSWLVEILIHLYQHVPFLIRGSQSSTKYAHSGHITLLICSLVIKLWFHGLSLHRRNSNQVGRYKNIYCGGNQRASLFCDLNENLWTQLMFKSVIF